MALKAGTVGIDPKYVDKNGKPVSDVDLSNYYTKSETDGKLDLKANQSYLTANNKKFQFAYDAESGKYGYKAGAQDDFHPFESAGAPGWNAPANPIHDTLTIPSQYEYVSGGYAVDDDYCYVDIVFKILSGGGYSITGFPKASGSSYLGLYNSGTEDNRPDDNYTATAYVGLSTTGSYGYISVPNVFVANDYVHIFGTYPLAS